MGCTKKGVRTVELVEDITRYILPREIIVPNERSNIVKVVKPDMDVQVYRRLRGATFIASGEINGDVPRIEYPVIVQYGFQYTLREERVASELTASGKAHKLPKSGWQSGNIPGCSK